MTVREFILQIANGSLMKDDILNFANQSWDKKNLLWDLWFADKAVDETLGKPLVTDEAGVDRIFNARMMISEQFDVSLVDSDQQDDNNEIQEAEQTVSECSPGKREAATDEETHSINTVKRGRPTREIRSLIRLTDKDAALKEMHQLLDGTKGKDLAVLVGCLVDECIMTEPTFNELRNEFGNLGNVSGYNNYRSKRNQYITDYLRKSISDRFK